MSKLLENIIRGVLLEQTNDWYIRIHFSDSHSKIGDEYRKKQAQSNAEKVGAIDGVPIVAVARPGIKNPTSNMSDIIKTIVQLMKPESGHTYGKSGKYDNGKYLYVLATVKSKPNRKVFNLMVFDRSKLGNLVNLLSNKDLIDPDLRKMSVSYLLPLLSDQQFITYIDRLKMVVDESNDVEIKKAWQETGLEQINLSAMRSSIKDKEHDAGVEETGKMVKLEKESSAEFTGTAITVFDPREPTISYKAINGSLYLYQKGGGGTTQDKFKFTGDFKDGIPHNGVLEFIEGNNSFSDSWHLKSFKGTLTDPGWQAGTSDQIIGGTIFDTMEGQGTSTVFKLIEAQYSVYSIGLIYKGTYDDDSFFQNGTLTQKTDLNTTNAVDSSRYAKFNITQFLFNRLNFNKVPVSDLRKHHKARIAAVLTISKMETVTAHIERGKIKNITDNRSGNLIYDSNKATKYFIDKWKEIHNQSIFKESESEVDIKWIKINVTPDLQDKKLKTENISDFSLLNTRILDGKTYYQFEYFNNKAGKEAPGNRFKYYILADKLTIEFIEAQKQLGNIK